MAVLRLKGGDMAGERRLHLYWDPELDGAFRRRFERALGDLKVEAADASMVDAGRMAGV